MAPSSDTYVVVEHPGEDEWRLPYAPVSRCDHVSSICATDSCVDAWERVVTVKYERTNGGRRLQRMLSR